MSDQRRKTGGPDRTTAIEVGEERPAPNGTNAFSKREPLPKNTKARLKLEAGPNAPALFEISEPMTVLGRGDRIADLDVGDGSASRRHACIEYKEGGFWLSDMGSTNGTILNGKLVSKARLANGDEIQIGTAVIRFQLS